MSALTGLNTNLLIPASLHAFDNWRTRVSTSLLNDWLQAVYKRHPPPRIKGKAMKFKYITQASSRPPTFVLFSSRVDMPETYKRFLTNSLREEFNLHGVPIRVHTRSRENPYDEKRAYDLKPDELKRERNTPQNKAKALQYKSLKLLKTRKYLKSKQ
jgi:GTP-binding protein